MPTRAAAKEASREALIRAGIALFEAHGVESPSLDAICHRAGYTRGAFYVHFPDREAFVVAVMEHLLSRWVETIAQTADPGGDLERSIRQFVDAVEAVRAGRGDPDRAAGTRQLHLLLEGCRRSERVRVRFSAVVHGAADRIALGVRAGQQAGTVRADVDPDGLALLLVGAVLGVLALVQAGTEADLRAAEATALSLVRAPPTSAGAARVSSKQAG